MANSKLSEFSRKYKSAYVQYIRGLNIGHPSKDILVRNELFIDDILHYLYYPCLFSEPFELNEDQKFHHLCIAGFLYYQSLISIDKAFDDKRKNFGLSDLRNITVFQEESLKILSQLFPQSSRFWELWNKRKIEYLKGFQIEHRKKPSSISTFKELADLKSAFGKVAIDACFVLSKVRNKASIYREALIAHKNFSWANQIIDDIQDIEEDLDQNQPNFAHFYVTTYAKDTDGFSPSQIKKHLYSTSALLELLKMAQTNYKSARTNSFFNSGLWYLFIEKIENRVNTQYEAARGFQKINLSRRRFSTTQFSNDSSSLASQIKLAIKFMHNEQNRNGSWEDFFTKAGLSDVWTTAFVTCNLMDAEKKLTPATKKARNFLSKNKQGHIWGYSTNWFADCDSSTFALMALTPNVTEKEFATWNSLQRKDGGFSTYANIASLVSKFGNEFTSFKGWMQSHVCVSSTALLYLSKLQNSNSHKVVLRFVLKSKSKNNLWQSYWWTSPVYASSYALRGLINSGAAIETKEILNSFKALVSMQNHDGSFSNNLGEKSAFFTALALSSICEDFKIYTRFKFNADLSAAWLLRNQFTDGSFPPSYILQIPNPGVVDPSAILKWSKSIKEGVNVMLCDMMRIFTTSACLQALSSYSLANRTDGKTLE